MNIGKKAGKMLYNSLSPSAKWRMVKANTSIIAKDLAKGLKHNKRAQIVTGAIAAGVAGSIAGITLLANRGHK